MGLENTKITFRDNDDLMNPKVSVIIPTYNRGHLIGPTINSVLAQSFRDFEIVVVDDGSVDNTKEVLEGFIESNPDIIRYYHQENGGCYVARNTGVKLARGKYISILDSDDLWLPFFLEVMVFELENSQPDIGLVYCANMAYDGNRKEMRWMDPQLMKDGNVLKEMVFRKIHICHGFALMKTKCFETTGLFNEKFRTGGDREYNYRLAKNFRIKAVKQLLCINRKHGIGNPLIPKGKNDTHIQYRAQIEEHEKIILDIMLADEDLHNQLFLFQRRIVSRFNYAWGRAYYVRGKFDEAKPYLVTAVRANPLNWKALAILIFSLLKYANRAEMNRINQIESISDTNLE